MMKFIGCPMNGNKYKPTFITAHAGFGHPVNFIKGKASNSWSRIADSFAEDMKKIGNAIEIAEDNAIVCFFHNMTLPVREWRSFNVAGSIHQYMMSIERAHFLTSIVIEDELERSKVMDRMYYDSYKRPFYPEHSAMSATLYIVNRTSDNKSESWKAERNHTASNQIWRYAIAGEDFRNLSAKAIGDVLDSLCPPNALIYDVLPHKFNTAIAALALKRNYIGVGNQESIKKVKQRIKAINDDIAKQTMALSTKVHKIRKEATLFGGRCGVR